MSNSFILLLDKPLSDATTPVQSGPGRDGNEKALCISQSSSFTGTLPSDCSGLYSGHSLGEPYLSAEMQLAYSTAPADWAYKSLLKEVPVV